MTEEKRYDGILKEYHDWDDIIDRGPPDFENHKPMDMRSRAAQFAPFAALQGYDDVIEEAEHEINSLK